MTKDVNRGIIQIMNDRPEHTGGAPDTPMDDRHDEPPRRRRGWRRFFFFGGLIFAGVVAIVALAAVVYIWSVARELPSTALKLTDRTLILELPAARQALLGETVTKRLGDLADAFGRKPDTVIV